MAVKLDLDTLSQARSSLRYALATYLHVAVSYGLISRAQADEMITEPDRAFAIFGTVEKALASRRRHSHYLEALPRPAESVTPAPSLAARSAPARKPKRALRGR